MSLINQMLKDLELRKKKPTDEVLNSLEKPIRENEAPPPFSISKRFIALFVVLASLIIVIVLMNLHLLHRQSPKPSVFVASPSAKLKPLTSLTPIAATPANSAKTANSSSDNDKTSEKSDDSSVITQIASEEALSSSGAFLNDIKVASQGTEDLITLYFTDKVHYQFDVLNHQQLLKVNLDNTQLQQPMADIIPAKAAAIKSISANPVQEDLEVAIQLQPNTEIKGLYYDTRDPTQLHVKLFSTLPRAVISREVSSSAATNIEKIPLPLSPKQLAAGEYQKALGFISQDQIDLAIQSLQLTVARYPQFIPARKSLIVLLMKSQQYDHALQLLKDGLKTTPDSVDLITLYARYYVVKGQLASALSVMKTISPPMAQALDYYALLATIRQRMGQPLVAMQLYEQLISLDSDNGTWWMGFGYALESAQKPNAAVQAYKRALTSNTLSPSSQTYVQSKISQLGG